MRYKFKICSTVLFVKYLFKYCYEGYECTLKDMKVVDKRNNEFDLQLQYDEIKQHINTRYICPQEAMKRLSEYRLHEMQHVIYR